MQLAHANATSVNGRCSYVYEVHIKFCMQLTKAYVAETSCNQLLID